MAPSFWVCPLCEGLAVYDTWALCSYPVDTFPCKFWYCFLIWRLWLPVASAEHDPVGLCFFSFWPPEDEEVRARFFELRSEPSCPACAELCPTAECFRPPFEAVSYDFLFDYAICWYFMEMPWRAHESLGRLALLFLSKVLPLSCLSCALVLALGSLSRCELATMFYFLC